MKPKWSDKSEKNGAARRTHFANAIYLILFFSIFACTTANYGSLRSSSEITNMFDNHQVLSDHLYYFSGLQGVPNAIIGIHPNYSLRSRTWQQVDLSSSTLKKWVFRMKHVQLTKPRGAWILDPDGNRVGIWFSAQRQTSVRMEPNNQVVISPPLPPELRGIP
jgi:hypothetical protein